MLELVSFILIGALAGWLGSMAAGDGNNSFWVNLILGIVGALVGGFLLRSIGIDFGGFVGNLFTAALGAAIVIIILRMVRKA